VRSARNAQLRLQLEKKDITLMAGEHDTTRRTLLALLLRK
jgi:hypothetical protein